MPAPNTFSCAETSRSLAAHRLARRKPRGTRMQKLGLTDASFLYFETPTTPMNIASVQLLEVPHDEFFDELIGYLAERVRRVPFMTKRLKSTPFGLDEPVWIDDPHFDVRNHVKRVKLAKPGTWRQLETLVARL